MRTSLAHHRAQQARRPARRHSQTWFSPSHCPEHRTISPARRSASPPKSCLRPLSNDPSRAEVYVSACCATTPPREPPTASTLRKRPRRRTYLRACPPLRSLQPACSAADCPRRLLLESASALRKSHAPARPSSHPPAATPARGKHRRIRDKHKHLLRHHLRPMPPPRL